MKIYEELDYMSEFKEYDFIDQKFKNTMLDKYSNLEVQYNTFFRILSYEIVNRFPIYKHEEYLKEIFTHIVSMSSDVNTHIQLADTFNQYSHDTEYKEKVFKFLLFKVATPFEHIKLFDLHRKMFDTSKSIVQMEEKVLLNEIANDATECFEIFCIGISYYQLDKLKKANKCIEKGFTILKNIDDVNMIYNIVYKFQEYCKSEKNICFRQGGWLTNFDDRLLKILHSHKGFEEYFNKKSELYTELF